MISSFPFADKTYQLNDCFASVIWVTIDTESISLFGYVLYVILVYDRIYRIGGKMKKTIKTKGKTETKFAPAQARRRSLA